MFGTLGERKAISEWTIDCLRMLFSCGTHGNAILVDCWISFPKKMAVPKAVPQRSGVGMYVLMLQHSLHKPSRSFTISSHLTSHSWIFMIDLHFMFGVFWRGSFTHYICVVLIYVRWWFQFVVNFHPCLGRWFNLTDWYVGTGLKPPISYGVQYTYIIYIYIILFVYYTYVLSRWKWTFWHTSPPWILLAVLFMTRTEKCWT